MGFIRSKYNPIIKPDPQLPWEKVMTYNPGAVFHKGRYHLFYRALGSAWVSKIGYAVSTDGERFSKDKEPIMDNDLMIEKNGMEDPRLTRIDDRFFMTYTAYDGECARTCLATSDNLVDWKKHGLVFPDWDAEKAGSFMVEWDSAQHNPVAKKQWNKAGAIFPAKIGGKFWMLFGDRNLWLAESADGKKWDIDYAPFLRPRNDRFDSVHIEMGPPPLETEKGWLVLYHGVDHKRIYRLGFLLLDKNDPRKILYRHTEAVFEPEESYEITGLVNILPGGLESMGLLEKAELAEYIDKAKDDETMPQVIFCTGAILDEKKLRIYYGAGDDVVCTAEINPAEFLALAEPELAG